MGDEVGVERSEDVAHVAGGGREHHVGDDQDEEEEEHVMMIFSSTEISLARLTFGWNSCCENYTKSTCRGGSPYCRHISTLES